MLKALGAKLVLTPAEKGVNGVILMAKHIIDSQIQPGKKVHAFPVQNPDNPKVHRETTDHKSGASALGKVDFLIGGIEHGWYHHGL